MSGWRIALLMWLFVAAWMFLMGAAIDELERTPVFAASYKSNSQCAARPER